MTLQILDEIARRMPLNSVYLSERTGRGQVTLGDRYALVLGDPSFGFNFASAYHKHQQNLPLFVQEKKYLPYRAFKYLTEVNSTDKALARAHSLWLDRNQGGLLEAFLLARDASPMRIARWFQISGATVVLYARLFFNVIERLNHVAFISKILHWHRTQLGLGNKNDQGELARLERAELRLKRVGYRKGVAGIFRALDMSQEGKLESPLPTVELLRSEAARDALPGVTQGLYDPKENPALELFMELTSQQNSSVVQEATDALTNLSLSKAINIDERFMQHIKPELERRLAVAHGEVPTAAKSVKEPPDPAGSPEIAKGAPEAKGVK